MEMMEATKEPVPPLEKAYHLFLLKNLPQGEYEDFHDLELELLRDLNTETGRILKPLGLQKIINALKTWEDIQAGEISLGEVLSELANGESTCYYVWKQNCSVIFTQLDENRIRLITFRGSIPNANVTGTAGSRWVRYPETVDVVPKSELLLSSCFSKQLVHLAYNVCEIAMPTTIKANQDVSKPCIVAEFLVAMLCPVDPAPFGQSGSHEKIQFQKKVRDQVNLHKANLPFRRSGLWTSAKIILQLMLNEETTDLNEVALLYKISILEVLVSNAKAFTTDPHASWDISAQMMAKLARRAKKLSKLKETRNSQLEIQRQQTLQNVFSTIDKVHSKVSKQWEKISVPTQVPPKDGLIHRSDTDWKSDCVHYMEKLSKYLKRNRINTQASRVQDNLRYIDPVVDLSSVTLDQLLSRGSALGDQTLEDCHMNSSSVWTYHVEWFVREHLTSNFSSENIYNLFVAYFEKTFELYGNEYKDPVSYSKMTITILKMVAVLDAIAVKRHPLLKQYKTSMNETLFELLENLLIPELREMELVASLKKYFTERNTQAKFGDWMEGSNLKGESFAVKYGESNAYMQQLKQNIVKDMDARIAAKEAELKVVRRECAVLEQKISGMTCTYVWNAYWEKDVHSRNCARCRTRSLLYEKQISVSRYQRPLPPKELYGGLLEETEHLRDAVVFEMIIPQEIAVLRDTSVLFLEDVLGFEKYSPRVDTDDVFTSWPDFEGLSEYSKTKYQKIIWLGSTCKDTKTKHNVRNNPDVNSANSSFIIENGLRTEYYRRTKKATMPMLPFTLKIDSSTNEDKEVYKSLQFALVPSRPTENETIAYQYSCHAKLNLREFKAFGTMRAANLAQIRNLYVEIATGVLSLGKEPVLQLIMQTLYELGPGNRDNHVDFEDPKYVEFANAYLELMEKTFSQNKSNWGNPLILLSITVITVRILVMTKVVEVDKTGSGIKDKISRLLQQYRVVLGEWDAKLENLITATSDLNDSKVLMQLQLKCAICTIFTFNAASPEDKEYIIRDPSDVTFFLKALSRLHHLVVREKILSQNAPSLFLQNLLREARLTIPLRIENYLIRILKQSQFNKGLHDFVCRADADAELHVPTFSNNHRNVEKKHAYQAKYTSEKSSHLVCVDILRGTFFKDGYPPSVLPESITRNLLFNSFFKTCQFKVQRDSQSYKTSDKYCREHFEFTEVDNDLIIRQLRPEGQWFELLPRRLFEDKVPHDILEEYTQWFDSRTKNVYFRSPSLSETEENILNDTHYIMSPVDEGKLDKWSLTKYGASNALILSIESEGFSRIVSNLEKLENKRFIHVIYSKVNDTVKVSGHLWRFHLTFTLNEEVGLLYCDNFPGFYISPLLRCGKNIGTLVGLESGLILEKETDAEVSGKKKILIIQHGTVKISDGRHQTTEVVCEETLRNPPYFVYDVDQVLNRLRPGQNRSAWLYLALLHGATSSPFVDPFTQLTGTEMGMWILQCGFSWSCSPYDQECVNTLKQIENLSPKYEYYPSHLKVMQKITYPKGLEMNSYAAYDGFALIVRSLIDDSSRLRGLFSGEKPDEEDEDLELCRKSYFRNITMYNPAAHLKPEFVRNVDYFSGEKLPSFERPGCQQDLAILASCRMRKAPLSSTQTIKNFLMMEEPLPHQKDIKLFKAFVPDWFVLNFRSSWLQFYELAQTNDEKMKVEHELSLIFGAILYSGNASLQQLLNLHNISISEEFQDPPVSALPSPYKPLDHKFVKETIKTIVNVGADLGPVQDAFETHTEYLQARHLFDVELKEQLKSSVAAIKSLWPRDSISMDILRDLFQGKTHLNSSYVVLSEINNYFKKWFNNLSLKRFIKNVEERMSLLGYYSSGTDMEYEAPGVEIRPLFELSYNGVADLADPWFSNICSHCDQEESGLMRKAGWVEASMSQIDKEGVNVHEFLLKERLAHVNVLKEVRIDMEKVIVGNCAMNKTMQKAGIYQRIAIVTLLRDHFDGYFNRRDHIGTTALLLAKLKRLNRLILFTGDAEKYSVELSRECKSFTCEKWSPKVYPEWLLLELELDITIRPAQVDVAHQMMKMPDVKNGVMQLNMGEGKTSVIIPMIVSTLSSSKEMLCRVTVLNSIFTTNYNLLTFTIGGLLNKRLYMLPCNRSMKLDTGIVTQIGNVYQECMRLGGAMITLPEYRLSFRLQMYNSALQPEREEIGQEIHRVESWIRNNVRDLVDESDEIFSVKYQLIYTTGKQLSIDGGSLRWSVCQKILKYLPKLAKELREESENSIEFNEEKAERNPETFISFRILKEECKESLNLLIAKAILNGQINLLGMPLREEMRDLVMEFLTNEDISRKRHESLLDKLDTDKDWSPEKRQILRLACGYLRKGILFAALKKRWRVEYGVKTPKVGTPLKLSAVPFRAKDVAAERTEFGHPDMAIVLTLLSYYYSGLSDEQLLECFHKLEHSITGPEGVYNSWICEIPPEKITSEDVRTYRGVNLQDYQQRKCRLFPILKHHTGVINFWLEQIAFPKECKQFPGKLVTNANDLCYERNVHPTTGFSGTNDTSLLLPAQITQQDLTELTQTNFKNEGTLKQPENTCKRLLPVGIGCTAVIENLTEDGLHVLIDAGALMLELGNEQVAKQWLKIDIKLKAVVYFNEDGEIAIKERNSLGQDAWRKDVLLGLSQYKERLEDCAVYLDDQHTRGTDIKLPTSFKACVTVGRGMRRDKLIQACMRMRKLGEGQSVHFYLSHEVDNSIRTELNISPFTAITVENIIEWSRINSHKYEKDCMVFWATNARTYTKNLAADDLFELSPKSSNDLSQLANRFVDRDAQTLQEMYETYHEPIKLTEAVPRWFSLQFGLKDLPESVNCVLKEAEKTIVKKCKENVPEAKYFQSLLEEEQEKELEPEHETQIEVFRPSKETPMEATLHENVLHIVKKQNIVRLADGIAELSEIFRNTTVREILQENGWKRRNFVTKDFIQTIETSTIDSGDSFLKTIRFLVSFRCGIEVSTLILSQFEANNAMTCLRAGKCSEGTTIHMFSGRWMKGQPTLFNDGRLQLPVAGRTEGRILTENEICPLLVAAGNLYFRTKLEEKSFADFLGLKLRPWSSEEEEASLSGLISNRGSVSPKHEVLGEGCLFHVNPIEMVIKILKMRNEIVRENDHAMHILETFSYVPESSPAGNDID